MLHPRRRPRHRPPLLSRRPRPRGAQRRRLRGDALGDGRLPAQPGVEIVLEPPVADPNASAEDRAAAAQLLAKGLLRGVNFRTEDCDATFERIRAAGGEVLQEPMDQFYGVRDCAFRDPSGNMLRFAQPRSR
ncbi:hypothetical protein GCM10025866_16900 [Naasia aerilata]|uniref:VOC domain-containing protein n=1 Tax=Naasia aerilata TaxID=1162966 RepID=A0ABM8GC18_9MICO|nr:hypothetical protein GCM10025866_16900 [Naasia aerilata]